MPKGEQVIYTVMLTWTEEITLRVPVPEKINVERAVRDLSRILGASKAVIDRSDLARNVVGRMESAKQLFRSEYGALCSFGPVRFVDLDIISVRSTRSV